MIPRCGKTEPPFEHCYENTCEGCEEIVLTEKEKEKYLQSPSVCPYCGSDDLDASSIKPDYDNHEACGEVQCMQCSRVWKDIYKLTAIVEEKC